MPTSAEIIQLLERHGGKAPHDLEGGQLVFVPWTPDTRELVRRLAEEVVALANALGGAIVVGIDGGAATVSEAIGGVGPINLTELRRQIYDYTEPHLTVHLEEIKLGDSPLLVVQVFQGMPPHITLDGVTKIRDGKRTVPLSPMRFRNLVASGEQFDFSSDRVPLIKPSDFDPECVALLREALAHAAKGHLANLPEAELLAKIRAVEGGEVTRAGLLLLGRAEHLVEIVRGHQVAFFRHRKDSEEDHDQRKDFRSGLVKILRESEHFVSHNNRVRKMEDGFVHGEVPDLSWEVAREGVLNAVTHRDYLARGGVAVKLYDGRLEINSPGPFIGGVTRENLLHHGPRPRNPALAQTLQLAGFVDQAGYGINRIYRDLLRLGKDAPIYADAEDEVRLTIYLTTHWGFYRFLIAEELRREIKFSLDELLILRALVNTPELDRWSASKLLQRSEAEAAKYLAQLRDQRYLVVRGRGNTASYDYAPTVARVVREESSLPVDGAHRDRVMRVLRDKGKLTNAEIQKLMDLTRNRATKLMAMLVASGEVIARGKGRGSHYVPRENKE